MAKYHNQQPNMANLMKQAQKMQQEMQKAQEELLSREYEATSGGGAVKVVYGGDKKLRAIEIDDDDFLCPGLVERLAQRLTDAIGAAGHDHDLAAHLHAFTPCIFLTAYAAVLSTMSSTAV